MGLGGEVELRVKNQRYDEPAVVAVSPDGARIAFAIGGSVHVRRQLDGTDDFVIAATAAELLFDQAGRMAAMTTNGVLVVSSDGAVLCRIDDPRLAETRHFGTLQRLAWAPNGDLLTRDQDFALWRIDVGTESATQLLGKSGTQPLRAHRFCFLDDGQLAVTNRGQLQVGDPSWTNVLSWHIDNDVSLQTCVPLSNGRLIVQTEDGPTHLLQVRDSIEVIASATLSDGSYERVVTVAEDELLVRGRTLVRWATSPFAAVAEVAQRPQAVAAGPGRVVTAVGADLIEYDDGFQAVASISPGAPATAWGVGFAGTRLLVGSGDGVRIGSSEGEHVLSTTDFYGTPISAKAYAMQLSGTSSCVAMATRSVPAGPDSTTLGPTRVLLSVDGQTHLVDTGAAVQRRFSWARDGSEVWGLSPDKGLVRIDVATREVRYVDVLRCNLFITPVVLDDEVVVAAKDGNLVVVNRSTSVVRLVPTGMKAIPNSVRSLSIVERRARLIDWPAQTLMEIPLDGGAAVPVCALPAFSDGRIAWSVSPSGRRIVGRDDSSQETVVVDDSGEIVASGHTAGFDALLGQPVWSGDGRYAWVAVDGSVVVISTE